jgi:TonB family protein
MEKYFLIATISSIVFYAVYYLFLRKESFHQFNRFYLLGALALSLVIPFIRFSVAAPIAIPVASAGMPSVANATVSNFTEFITYIQLLEFTVFAQSPAAVSWWNISNLLLAIYFSGVIVLSILFIIRLVKIFSLFIQSSKNRNGKYIYVKYNENMAPFSFFNYIFINTDAYNEEDRERILIHEQIHARQRHSWDLIFVELISVLLWFNPILIMYKRSLQVIHEYLADHRVLQYGFEQGAYLNLLLRQLTLQNAWVMGHHFNYLLTKNRFKMLKNNHYSKWAIAKFTLALPFIALLLMLNCKNKNQEATSKEFIPETVVFELEEGTPVITAMIPEPELPKEGSSDSKTMKDKKPSLLQLIEEGKMWDCNSFIEELKSEFVYLSEGQYLYCVDSGKPDFIEILCAKHKKPIYEAQRDESGKIYVTELATGEKDPDYLKISKEDANTAPLRFVQEMPEPIGGFDAMYQFIYDHIKYPAEAREKKIGGQVFLEFVIEKDGRVSCVKVLSGVHSDLDAEALRVIKMLPKWKPGMQNGKPVRCFYQIPIRFSVN